MHIQLSKLCPKKWKMNNITHHVSTPRKAAIQSIQESFVLEPNSELATKRKLVLDYISGKKPADKTKPPISFEEIIRSDNTQHCIDLCGNNVGMIDNIFGHYGLALFANISPAKIMKNSSSKIKEVKYCPDQSVRDTFNSYLLCNKSGNFADIGKRFGSCGAKMFNDASDLGYIKTGVFGSYKLTEFGKDYLTEVVNATAGNLAHEDLKMLLGK